MYKKILFSLLSSAIFATQAYGAEISLSKLRINLDNARTSEFISLANQSADKKEAYEVSIKKWRQVENPAHKTNKNEPMFIDQFEDTNSILVSPKTAVILPKQEKVVRLIVNDGDVAKKDYSYRLFVTQLPGQEATPTGQTVGINVLFKMSIPVFVTEGTQTPVDKMKISYSFKQEDGKNYLYFANNDVQHVQLKNFFYKDKTYSINKYILPNITDRVAIPEELRPTDFASQNVKLITDKGDITLSQK